MCYSLFVLVNVMECYLCFRESRKQYVALWNAISFILERQTESEIFYESCDNRLDLN